MTILTQTDPIVNEEDEIPFYDGNVITAATTTPIADPIGDMLRQAQRVTPLEEVAEHVFDEVYQATGDMFEAWEKMSQVWLTAAGENGKNGTQEKIINEYSPTYS